MQNWGTGEILLLLLANTTHLTQLYFMHEINTASVELINIPVLSLLMGKHQLLVSR